MIKYGVLSDYFEGAGAKRVTEVEINKLRSHQHEFQGVSAFRRILGTPSDKFTFPSTFYWLDDNEENEPISIDSFCTWSDVRRKNPNRGPEYHLYYSADSERVVSHARAGDLLLIAITKQHTLLVILCSANTTIEQQLLWLFGLDLGTSQVDVKALQVENSVQLSFAAKSILDDLGIETEEPEPDVLEILLDQYRAGFPTTGEFSKFARDSLRGVDPVNSPDDTLVAWMDHEETLFYHLEKHMVSERLKTGFVENNTVDVAGFIKYSLSVQNRRKSRAGYAFEHHTEAIFRAHKIACTRYPRPKVKGNPDFLFPSEIEYRNLQENTAMLTMLGAKTSCKERWRQVLAEAPKIERKHLLTLQAGIAESQTDEMESENLQLVVPRSIFDSYRRNQRDWLMDVSGFLELVKARQLAVS